MTSWMRSAIILCCSLLTLAGCAAVYQPRTVFPEIPASELGRRIPPVDLQKDFSFLVRTLEEVHPDLYAYTDPEAVRKARRRIEMELVRPLTRTDFFKLVAPFVAQIGDGHTSVFPPTEEYLRFRSEGGLAFPFVVIYDSTRGVAVSRNLSGDASVAEGDLIHSVNGLLADSLLRAFASAFSGEREVFRTTRTAVQFRLLLWLHNIDSPYTVEFVSGDSVSRTLRLPGISQNAVVSADSLRARQPVRVPNYSFRRIDGNIGNVDFRSMTDILAFDVFLETTFREIKDHPVRGLIIDLRNNGGGDSRLGDALFSFITDSSYQQAERKEWKMSSQYKSYMRSGLPWWLRWFPLTWVSAAARNYHGAEDGTVVVQRFARQIPRPNPLKYRGKVCFLMGPGTFSSATMLANAVGDFKLATLIGEETGGIPNAFGEIYRFELPASRLRISVSSARFVRANGDAEDRRGVIPDIAVRQSDVDTRKGVDSVLEAGKRWIYEVGRLAR